MTTPSPEPNPGPVIRLEQWNGPWDDGDPDANFKHDVALYTKLDPLATITNLGNTVDIPVGALCRYVLAKWASAGAESIMTLGATAIERLNETIEEAESADTDQARLAAYQSLKAQLQWLTVPLKG